MLTDRLLRGAFIGVASLVISMSGCAPKPGVDVSSTPVATPQSAIEGAAEMETPATPSVAEVGDVGPGRLTKASGERIPLKRESLRPANVELEEGYITLGFRTILVEEFHQVVDNSIEGYKNGTVAVSDDWVTIKPSSPVKVSFTKIPPKVESVEGLLYADSSGNLFVSLKDGVAPKEGMHAVGQAQLPRQYLTKWKAHDKGVPIRSFYLGRAD